MQEERPTATSIFHLPCHDDLLLSLTLIESLFFFNLCSISEVAVFIEPYIQPQSNAAATGLYFMPVWKF
jgi:hypothetical protein